MRLTLAALGSFSAVCAFAQSTASSDDQYRQGLYQRETGQPYSAIETLQSLLAADPSLNRARLELAVSYYRTLNFAKAKAEAQAVLNDPKTPEPVRLSVLSFLKQLELEEKAQFGKPHRFEPSFSLSALYDSNVNAGPDSALLSGGLQLDPGSTAKADSGYAVQAGLNHSWTAPVAVRMGESTGRFGWNSQVSGYYKGYTRLSDYNLGVATVATGPTLVVGQGWRGNVNFQADRLTLGDKALALYSSISPSSTWSLGKGSELTVDAQWVYRNFDRDQDQGRTSHYNSVGLSYGGLFNQNRLALQGGVRLFSESAKESRFSNSGYEYFVGGRQNVWTGGDLFARASWRHSGYEGDEVFFGIPRRETEQRLELGASHQYQAGWLDKWQTAATLTRVHNQANLDLYRYDRDMVQVTLGRSY
ncbi:MAG: hypothetical protein KGL90_05725 [Burkholderiales bacterium]|nr:hypothetical protein [Burkholderiales bacterium]